MVKCKGTHQWRIRMKSGAKGLLVCAPTKADASDKAAHKLKEKYESRLGPDYSRYPLSHYKKAFRVYKVK